MDTDPQNHTAAPEPIPPPNPQKKTSLNLNRVILLGIVLLGIGGLGGYLLASGYPATPDLRACTMEAKICPDGSSVGRTGPDCEFASCPDQPVAMPSAIAPSEPGTTAIPTSKPVSIVPMDTSDWKNVTNNGVRFKIPSNASCNNYTACTEVAYPNVFQGTVMPLPARILIGVTEYSGGSRREQFFAAHDGDRECKPLFVDTLFGTVDALQIAIDGGWCQGGYNGTIVAVIGNKFVILGPGLGYNDNKEISRWDVRDTLVSTLSPE